MDYGYVAAVRRASSIINNNPHLASAVIAERAERATGVRLHVATIAGMKRARAYQLGKLAARIK